VLASNETENHTILSHHRRMGEIIEFEGSAVGT